MACRATLSHRPAFDRIYLRGFAELITLSQLLIDGQRTAVVIPDWKLLAMPFLEESFNAFDSFHITFN